MRVSHYRKTASLAFQPLSPVQSRDIYPPLFHLPSTFFLFSSFLLAKLLWGPTLWHLAESSSVMISAVRAQLAMRRVGRGNILGGSFIHACVAIVQLSFSSPFRRIRRPMQPTTFPYSSSVTATCTSVRV